MVGTTAVLKIDMDRERSAARETGRKIQMRKYRGLAVLLTAAVCLAACGGSSSGSGSGAAETSAAESGAAETSASESSAESMTDKKNIAAKDSEIHIGTVNPMSGDNALYGLDQQRGLQLAFDEINAAGGVNGADLVLEEYDDQGDPQNAAKGAQKFADDDDIVAITGSSLTSCTLAMVPIIDDAGLVDTVVSSSSPSLANCSDYFFRMAVQDAQVGPQMAKAALKKDHKKFDVLYTNNDFGKNLSDNLIAYAKENGGEIVNTIEYNPTDQDFTAILTTVKQDAPEAVALCGTVTDCSLIIKQMKSLGIDTFIICHTSLYSAKALEIAGDAMEGVDCVSVYISTNPDPKVQEFVKKYEDKYGETPDSFAAMAYDQAYVLAAAADYAMQQKDGEVDREGMHDGMKATNYDGVTGTVTFDENNEWVRDYLTLTVKNGEFTLDE